MKVISHKLIVEKFEEKIKNYFDWYVNNKPSGYKCQNYLGPNYLEEFNMLGIKKHKILYNKGTKIVRILLEKDDLFPYQLKTNLELL